MTPDVYSRTDTKVERRQAPEKVCYVSAEKNAGLSLSPIVWPSYPTLTFSTTFWNSI